MSQSSTTFSLGNKMVNRLGYGAMRLAGPGIYGPPADPAGALAVLRTAVESGVNHIDTSDARFSFNSMQDLKGKSIGAVRGYSYGPEFDLAKNKVFHVEEDISSRSSRLKKLLSKRMDALLVYQLSTDSAEEVEAGINAFMANEVKDMALPAHVSFSVLPKPLQVDFIYFCVAKNKDDGLIARINAALVNGKKTGDLLRAMKGP